MKNAILAVVLTVAVSSMAYAGNAMDVLKNTAGPVAIEQAAIKLPEPKIERRDVPNSVTVSLEKSEINAVIDIFNRVGVKGRAENADCYSTEVIIDNRSLNSFPASGSHQYPDHTLHGFNPAKWSIMFNDDAATLTKEEIPSMIDMFNRLQVKSSSISGITRVSEVTIKSRTCNLRPAVWTVTYYKNILTVGELF